MNFKNSLFKPLISVENSHQKWFVLFAVCLSLFTYTFYIGMINVVLPTIIKYYHADVMTATWVANIFQLTIIAFILFSGRIGGLWSRRKFFILGMLIWSAASLLCYFSTSTDTIILFRGIQGLAAGFMLSIYYVIIKGTFPQNKLGLALGFVIASTSAGYAIGPVVGGHIAVLIGWHAIFLAVIPFSLISAIIYSLTAQKPEVDNDLELLKNKKEYEDIYPHLAPVKIIAKILDYKGAILQTAILSILIYLLIKAQLFKFDYYDYILIILIIIFGILFVLVELKNDEPLFRFTIFRNIRFTAFIIGLLLNYLTLFMVFFTVPFYLQSVLNLPVDVSGNIISVVWFSAMFISIFAGRLTDKIGVKTIAISACVIFLIAIIMINVYYMVGYYSTIYIILIMILLGMGYGLYQSPNNKMILSVTPPAFITQVSSMMSLTKNLGSVLGNSFAGLIIATSISQSALSGVDILSESQITSFMIGFEKILLFGAFLSVLLLISTLDLEKYVNKYFKTPKK